MTARPFPLPLPEGSVMLWVGSSSSTCGACGMSCLPDEETHSTRCGYDQHEGCGARYTHITSVYLDDHSNETVQRMRPDLVFMDLRAVYRNSR